MRARQSIATNINIKNMRREHPRKWKSSNLINCMSYSAFLSYLDLDANENGSASNVTGSYHRRIIMHLFTRLCLQSWCARINCKHRLVLHYYMMLCENAAISWLLCILFSLFSFVCFHRICFSHFPISLGTQSGLCVYFIYFFLNFSGKYVHLYNVYLSNIVDCYASVGCALDLHANAWWLYFSARKLAHALTPRLLFIKFS